MSKKIGIDKQYELDSLSFTTTWFNAFLQRFQVIYKDQRCYAYRPIGIARFSASIYEQYRALRCIRKCSYPESDPRYGDYVFVDGANRLSAELIAFLIRAVAELKKYQIVSQKHLSNEIFGIDLTAKQNLTAKQSKSGFLQSKIDHFKLLLQQISKNNEKTWQQILSSNYYAQTVYEADQEHLKWFHTSNLFEKLQIIPRAQKLNRIRKLQQNLDLWNIRLIKTSQEEVQQYGEYLIITDPYQPNKKKKKDFKQLKNIEQLVSYNVDNNIRDTPDNRRIAVKKLGADIIRQLRMYQEGTGNNYIWTSPKNILNNPESGNYFLSHVPVILEALGVSKEPLTMEQKLVFYTPKGIDLYMTPQMLHSEAGSKTTSSFQLMLLLDHFERQKHIFQESQNEIQLHNKWQTMQNDLIQRHRDEDTEQMDLIAVVMIQSLKLSKIEDANWFDHQKRPTIEDLEYHFIDERSQGGPPISKKSNHLRIELLQFQIYKLQDYYKIVQFNKAMKDYLGYIHLHILEYYLTAGQWLLRKQLKMLKNSSQQQHLNSIEKCWSKTVKSWLNLSLSINGQLPPEETHKDIKWTNELKRYYDSIGALHKKLHETKQPIDKYYLKIYQKLLQFFEAEIFKKEVNSSVVNTTNVEIQKKLFLEILILQRLKEKNVASFRLLSEKIRAHKQLSLKDFKSYRREIEEKN